MHQSIATIDSPEFINLEPLDINPLMSKCEIKVFYLGENRNHSYITKDVATEMAKTLRGAPIVGYYKDSKEDFADHGEKVTFDDEGIHFECMTRPYGFVAPDAKVWFQKFQDDDGIIREYLLTEGYIWSDIYPESKRIIEQGNNQSMELNKDSVKGNWTDSLNSKDRFFIINEAIIEKLCILGENYEPCFEGAQIKAHFSLNDEFAQLKNAMYSMMQELNLSKGGTNMAEKTDDLVVAVEEIPAQVAEETPVITEEKVENFEKISDETEQVESVETKETVEEQKYNLEEIAEYVELKDKFDALTSDYTALKEQYDALSAEIEPLKEFKLVAEREKKKAMINKFFMLSDEDKKDVIDNIDSYSLDDIEAKLSVICVRNKVSFNLDEDKEEKEEPLVFNLNTLNTDSDIPDWIKAVKNNI